MVDDPRPTLDLTTAEMPILFELSRGELAKGTLRDLAGGPNPVEMAKQSAEVLNGAMRAIEGMANRTRETLARLDTPPAALEVDFAIKMDAKLGAIVSGDASEGALRVKLVWRKEDGDPGPSGASSGA
ncbi:MAG: hypothetical protein MH825_06970 [Cyanobacteria bacterium]|nr:hypothetical protein [Cyanobacteriota bacterium]